MKIKFVDREYRIIDHKYKKIKLSYNLQDLKEEIDRNKEYSLLKDDKNLIDCLVARIKLKEIKDTYIVMEVVFYGTGFDIFFREVTKNGEFAINPIKAINGELCALGITPIPTEIYPKP